MDEEFGEDSVAVRLIEDYLEGKITSLIDLSQLLKDEAGLIISKSTLARRLKGKVCCLIIQLLITGKKNSACLNTALYILLSFQVNVKVRRKRGYHQRRAGVDE